MTTTCERPVFSRLDADPPSVQECARLRKENRELQIKVGELERQLKNATLTLHVQQVIDSERFDPFRLSSEP